MVEGKKVAIIGGAGFIGTSLAEGLVDQNQVILLDSSFENQPFCYSTKLKEQQCQTHVIDVLKLDSFAQLIQDGDVIIHLAAIVGVQRVRKAVRRTLDVNYVGTANVVSAALQAKRPPHLIFFSTSEIFGANSFRAEEGSSASIGHVSEARWCYSVSKLAGEHVVWAAYREEGLPVTIVRPFNVFGPKRVGDHAMIRFVIRALLNRPLYVHGTGTQLRSWCYIDDLCDAVMKIIEIPQARGEDFNIGDAQNTLTIYQLAQRIIDICDSKSKIEFENPNFEDVDIRVVETKKATRLLGYNPSHNLDDSLRRTIDWYRKYLDTFSASYG